MNSVAVRRVVGATTAALLVAALTATSATAADLPSDPAAPAATSPAPSPAPDPAASPSPATPPAQPEATPKVTPQPVPQETPEAPAQPAAAETAVPPANEQTAAQATAPGLAPPSTGSFDLVGPVPQRPPSSTASPETSADQEEAYAALLAAREALDSAEAQLAAAQGRLAEAERARAAAAEVRDRAAQEAAAARVAQVQAERELTDGVSALDEQRELLGSLAREAYRSGGPLTSLTVVLESSSPKEFAANLRAVEAVLRSEDVVIAGLAAELAELAEARARLAAALEERERAEQVAQQAFDLASQAEQTARTVAEETQALVDLREQALATALGVQAEELARSERLMAASQAVGFSLTGWAELLDDPSAVAGTGAFVRPGTGSLTSRFGPRLHPILGYVKLHTGSDYGLGDGTIRAADDGTVVLAGYNSAYGNMTVISHGRIGGAIIATLYAHQSRIAVGPGERVDKGQLIGFVGSTGYSTGPHLHFEVRVNGTPVDPETWLVGAPTAAEYLADVTP
jgi:murein DD-endopeptidase MepM/ murein hydrolase activator NlpD